MCFRYSLRLTKQQITMSQNVGFFWRYIRRISRNNIRLIQVEEMLRSIRGKIHRDIFKNRFKKPKKCHCSHLHLDDWTDEKYKGHACDENQVSDYDGPHYWDCVDYKNGEEEKCQCWSLACYDCDYLYCGECMQIKCECVEVWYTSDM